MLDKFIIKLEVKKKHSRTETFVALSSFSNLLPGLFGRPGL